MKFYYTFFSLRQSSMAEHFRQQMQDPHFSNLSFEERFIYLVDTEYSSRQNNRLKKLLKDARFDQNGASIADLNYLPERRLNKALIQKLSMGEYIREAHNVIIMGATGTGKSYLACALGVEACKQHYTVHYVRLPELLNEISIAKGLGTYQKLMRSLQKKRLLILDEWLLTPLTDSESKDLFELVHARHKKTSTIFCSQFVPKGWHKKIGEATLADAILDRIVYDSYTVEIPPDVDMRKVYGLKQ